MPKTVSADDEIGKAFRQLSGGDRKKVETGQDNVLFWCPGKKAPEEKTGRLPSLLVVGSYSFPKEDQRGAKPGFTLKELFNCSKTLDRKPCYCHDVLLKEAQSSSDPLRRKQALKVIGDEKNGGPYNRVYLYVADLLANLAISPLPLTAALARRLGTADTKWHGDTGHHLCEWKYGTAWGFRKVEIPQQGVRYFQLPYNPNDESPKQGFSLLNEQYGVGFTEIVSNLGIDMQLSDLTEQLGDLRKLKDTQPASKKWLDDTLAPFLGIETKVQIQRPDVRRSAPKDDDDADLDEGGEDDDEDEGVRAPKNSGRKAVGKKPADDGDDDLDEGGSNPDADDDEVPPPPPPKVKVGKKAVEPEPELDDEGEDAGLGDLDDAGEVDLAKPEKDEELGDLDDDEYQKILDEQKAQGEAAVAAKKSSSKK